MAVPTNKVKNKRTFNVELLDPDKLVSVNNLKQVSNPIFFKKDNIPTDDGLLSYEVFGTSKAQRSNEFAYIDLNGNFIHPFIYRLWNSMDRRIESIVYGNLYVKIDDNGMIIEDEDGSTGIDFLKKNINKIKFKRTDSSKRDTKIAVLEEYRDKIFINKCIVIPAYYRDVESSGRSGIGVGDINKLYSSLLIFCNSLKETQDYGLDISDATRGRIQNTLSSIYEWFVDEPNLSKKNGLIRRAVLSKTSDYASRLVISAPNVDAERYDDLMVDLDYSAVPLASVCANLYPYIIFNLRKFFDNQFSGGLYPVMDKKGVVTYKKVYDYMDQFSDDKLKKAVDRYIKGFSNRIIPIEIKMEDKTTIWMKFKGKRVSAEDAQKPGEENAFPDRRLTWLDVIYMAAVEAAKDKCVLITRYPLESYMGQFPTKIVVASTKKTEPMMINDEVYKYYPYIREELILSNTSNLFIDTLQMSNLYLKAIGGDYDGDQVTVKAAFTIESNAELQEYMNAKYHYIDVSGSNIREFSNEAIQALYSFTKIMDNTLITLPEF